MNIEHALFRVLDTETTGLEPETARIVEIGACDVYATTAIELGGNATRYVQSAAESWLCNPGIPIPAEAKAIHHIIDADVAGKPAAAAIWATLLPATAAASHVVYVAHHAKYDREVLIAHGFPTWPRWLCTWRLAMHVWPDAPSYKNEVLRYWLGHDRLPWRGREGVLLDGDAPAQTHRAAHDVAVTALILREAIGRLGERALREPRIAAPVDVDELIAWAESPVVLKGKLGFGKHFDKTWAQVAETDAGYLDWMIKQDEREPGAWEIDKIHTARHYRGRLV